MGNVMQIKQGPSRERLFDSLRLGLEEDITVEFIERKRDGHEGDRIRVAVTALCRCAGVAGISDYIFSGRIVTVNDEEWKNREGAQYLVGKYDTEAVLCMGWMKFSPQPQFPELTAK